MTINSKPAAPNKDTKPVSRIVQHADRVRSIKPEPAPAKKDDCSRFHRHD